jgi:hypothetical protein
VLDGGALGATMKDNLLVFVGGALLCAGLSSSTTAFAQAFDPRAPEDLPDAPSPPSLLDLTHRSLYVAFETTQASVRPNDIGGVPQGRVFGGITRLEGELAIDRARRFFAGFGEEVAVSGLGQGTVLPSYPEIWGRAVWASRAGLAYGGGLGFVLPVFSRDPNSEAARASQLARVVKPWSFSLFSDNTFTARPFLDARVIDGSVTLQFRQSLELQGLVADAQLPTRSLVSRTTVYLGYQPVKPLGFGLEVTEVYFISASSVCVDVPKAAAPTTSTSGKPIDPGTEKACTTLTDDLRAAFVLSPSVRFTVGDFHPAVSAIVPFGQTLLGEARNFWAVRLSLGAVFEL